MPLSFPVLVVHRTCGGASSSACSMACNADLSFYGSPLLTWNSGCLFCTHSLYPPFSSSFPFPTPRPHATFPPFRSLSALFPVPVTPRFPPFGRPPRLLLFCIVSYHPRLLVGCRKTMLMGTAYPLVPLHVLTYQRQSRHWYRYVIAALYVCFLYLYVMMSSHALAYVEAVVSLISVPLLATLAFSILLEYES